MRYLLQRPLPDELLSSALVRTCVRFDLAIKPLMRELGVNASAPSFFHMSNVGAYARLLQLDPVSLLHSSTLFPTLMGFQTWNRRLAYQDAAISGGREHAVKLSALQTTSTFVPFRRLCAQCVRSDLRRHRFAYWHVSHHLPGVTLCVHHGSRLRDTKLTTSSVGSRRWSYLMADQVDSVVPPRRANRFDTEINRLALSMQAGELWSALEQLPPSFYRHQLEQAGLVGLDRQVNALKARAWIASHLSGLIGLSPVKSSDPTLAWVDLILRDRPSAPFPAIRHLTILAALSASPKPFGATLNHKSVGYRGRDVVEIDRRTAKELDARLRKRLKSSDRFTLQGELEDLGIWSSFRHNRSKFPALSAVVTRHRKALYLRRKPGGRRCPSPDP